MDKNPFDFIKIRLGKRDFLLYDHKRSVKIPTADFVTLIPRLCHRHKGIGAEGLIEISWEEDTPYVTFFYATGQEEPDPDAYLCAARYLFEGGVFGDDQFTLKTPFGEVKVVYLEAGTFMMDMGMPLLEGRSLSSPIQSDEANIRVPFSGKTLNLTKTILHHTGLVHIPLKKKSKKEEKSFYKKLIGEQNLSHPLFRAYPLSPGEYKFTSFQRGSTIEAAAHTGLALVLNGLGSPEMIGTKGKTDFFFHWTQTLSIAARPEYVFTGNWPDEIEARFFKPNEIP